MQAQKMGFWGVAMFSGGCRSGGILPPSAAPRRQDAAATTTPQRTWLHPDFARLAPRIQVEYNETGWRIEYLCDTRPERP